MLDFFKKSKNTAVDKFYTKKLGFDGYEFDICIHPAQSRAVLIIYPGADGSMDGYNEKYLKIANLLQQKNIATVIRLDNKYYSDKLPYVDIMLVKLSHVIEHAYEHAEEIAGVPEIELYLAGVSAGAGAVATLLFEFKVVKKTLLIAPADTVGTDNISRGLKDYRGELYISAGENDEIGAAGTSKLFYGAARQAKRRELVIIPKCDHRFTGKRNGMILSNAFLWAFANTGNFPSHKGGLFLYK